MNAKEYLTEITKICDEYDRKGNCDINCPLYVYQCGTPRDAKNIDAVIELVKNYEANRFPYGQCNHCEKEFDQELREKYNICNCPWCGSQIGGGIEDGI